MNEDYKVSQSTPKLPVTTKMLCTLVDTLNPKGGTRSGTVNNAILGFIRRQRNYENNAHSPRNH